jgi:hypothetical protein
MMVALLRREASRIWFVTLLSAMILMLAWTQVILKSTREHIYSLPWIDGSSYIVSAFGFAVVGLVLGFLQGRSDGSGTAWAVWQLRPISFFRVFVAKFVVGWVFVLTSTLGLAALVFGWALTPGHIAAPMSFAMFVPIILDAGLALAFYATGFTIGVGRGGWFTHRLLPLGLPVLAAFAINLVPHVAVAALLIVLSIVSATAAAWSVFRVGDSGNQPSPFGLSAISFARFAGASLVLGLLVSLFMIYTEIDPWMDPPNTQTSRFRFYNFDRQGNAHLQSSPLRPTKSDAQHLIGTGHREPRIPKLRLDPSDITIVHHSSQSGTLVYLLEKKGALIEYDSNKRILTREWKIQNQRCAGQPCTQSDILEIRQQGELIHVVTPSVLLSVDLKTLHNKEIYRSPTNTIVAAGTAQSRDPITERIEHFTWIWEKSNLTLIDARSGKKISMALPPEAKESKYLSVFQGENKKFIVAQSNKQGSTHHVWVTIHEENKVHSSALPSYTNGNIELRLRPAFGLLITPVWAGLSGWVLGPRLVGNFQMWTLPPLAFWLLLGLSSLLSALVSFYLVTTHQAGWKAKTVGFIVGLLGGFIGTIVIAFIYPWQNRRHSRLISR